MAKSKRSQVRIVDLAYDDFEIGGNAKLIFVIMCRVANTSGICFLAIDTIARMAGVKRSTVTRKVAELQKSGRLVRIEGKKGRATWTYRVYPGGKLRYRHTSNCGGAPSQYDPQNPKEESKNIKKDTWPPVDSLGKSERLNRSASIDEVARRLLPYDSQVSD